jgi:hypothetical protein
LTNLFCSPLFSFVRANLFKAILILGCVAAMMPNSRGQIIIDPFNVNTSTQLSNQGTSSEQDAVTINGQSATRTLTVSGSGSVIAAQVDSNVLQFAVTSGASNALLNDVYNSFSTPLDASSDPILEIDFPTIVGAGSAASLINSNSGPSLVMLSAIPAGSGSTESLYFDLRQAPTYQSTSLDQVTSITVGFSTPSGQALGISVSDISLEPVSVVPEPCTYALLLAGLLVLGAWRWNGKSFARS